MSEGLKLLGLINVPRTIVSYVFVVESYPVFKIILIPFVIYWQVVEVKGVVVEE